MMQRPLDRFDLAPSLIERRLPDFLIIGAMKAGTTTLHHWLNRQPEIAMSLLKETHFFSREHRWTKGFEWYADMFRAAGKAHIVGESCPSYMSPMSKIAAARIREFLPDVQLIAVLRDPVARVRSHYRHQVLEGKEYLRFRSAISSHLAIVGQSRYGAWLRPYFDLFDRDQIHIERFEDVFGENEIAWNRILRFLGLDPRPRPEGVWQAAADKRPFARARRWLRSPTIERRVARMPAPVLRAWSEGWEHADAWVNRRLASADDPIPEDIMDVLRADNVELRRLPGLGNMTWPSLELVDGDAAAYADRSVRAARVSSS